MLLTQTLIAPVVTEKSSAAQADGKYTFRVHSDATKIDVKNAVKAAYGIDVDSVNVKMVRKKTRMYGRRKTMVKRPAAKIAIVTTKDKKTIDFNKVTTSK